MAALNCLDRVVLVLHVPLHPLDLLQVFVDVQRAGLHLGQSVVEVFEKAKVLGELVEPSDLVLCVFLVAAVVELAAEGGEVSLDGFQLLLEVLPIAFHHHGLSLDECILVVDLFRFFVEAFLLFHEFFSGSLPNHHALNAIQLLLVGNCVVN